MALVLVYRIHPSVAHVAPGPPKSLKDFLIEAADGIGMNPTYANGNLTVRVADRGMEIAWGLVVRGLATPSNRFQSYR